MLLVRTFSNQTLQVVQGKILRCSKSAIIRNCRQKQMTDRLKKKLQDLQDLSGRCYPHQNASALGITSRIASMLASNA